MGIKTYQWKNTKPMKKELAQSDLPVWRKIKKTARNVTFLEKDMKRLVDIQTVQTEEDFLTKVVAKVMFFCGDYDDNDKEEHEDEDLNDNANHDHVKSDHLVDR